MNPNKKYSLGIKVDYALRMEGGKALVEEGLFIGVINDRINYIGKFRPAHKQQSKKFLEKRNHVLLPGFVNGHTHLPMSLFRGVADDVPLKVWLFEKIFPLEEKFVDKKFVKAGMRLSALECIRFGVTTVNDMYFFADEALQVWDQYGLRGIFSQNFISYPSPEDKVIPAGFEAKKKQFEILYKKFQGHSRLLVGLAPHAPYTCSPELLKQVSELSRQYQARIHIHVAETKAEVEESLKKYGKTPVEHLRDLGVLGPLTTCAHGVHLNEQDIAILKKSGASVVHNPDSNTKLASGVAPVSALRASGVPVALGTDGVASNNDLSMFGVMDLTAKLQNVHFSEKNSVNAEAVLSMATVDGAKALGLESEVGSIEIGKKADLILVDLNFPHLQPLNNLVSQLVYSMQGLEVDVVICDGKLLMNNKKISPKLVGDVFKVSQRYSEKIKKTIQRKS